jgi:hypothetical protein
LDATNGTLHGTLTLRGVHLLVDHHLLVHARLIGVVSLLRILAGTKVHQSFNGLFPLRGLWLELVV